MPIKISKSILSLVTTLFLVGCDFIPFIGHDNNDNSDLNNALILALATRGSGGSAGAGNPGPCPSGGPSNRRDRDTVEHEGSRYIVGFSQTTSIRQDAYALKTTGDRIDWCRFYDRSPADTRGEKVAINNDGNELFVAFTLDGGNANFRATANAVQNSYGQGGGAKITFLARLNPGNGEIRNATFLGARLTNGRTNTLTPTEINIGNDIVTFIGNTAADRNAGPQPLDTQNCKSGATRTVVMPFELTRDTPFSVECSERD